MKKLKAATFCSGIGAPEVAMGHLFNFEWCSEIDKFPSAVLAQRFSNVKNIGDMLKRSESHIYKNSSPELLIAGTPCQGFSVAGDRGGLESDDRSKLTLEFVRALQEKLPKWFIWENVPGIFSSGGDRDFPAIVRAFTNIGYGICWRVLDAQYFGVPQRRRRIYIVGYFGDWRPPFKVLFESESLRGNIKTSGIKKENIARKFENSAGEETQVIHGTQDPCVSKKSFCLGRNSGQENVVIINSVHENQRAELTLNKTIGSLKTQGGKPGQGYPCILRYSKSHRKHHIDQRIIIDGTSNTLNTSDGCAGQSTQNIIFEPRSADGCPRIPNNQNICPTLNTMGGGQREPCVSGSIVRKLTPLECERLQGFPDNWTAISYRGKTADLCPLGPRYKAIGNSMAVPVMRWIGERLNIVDKYIRLQS